MHVSYYEALKRRGAAGMFAAADWRINPLQTFEFGTRGEICKASLRNT